MILNTDAKTILASLKALFNTPVAPAAPVATSVPAAPAAMADVQLLDGTTVQIDNLAVGGKVMIQGVPAPDAEYQLADGTVITTVGGTISELETVQQSTNEPDENMKKCMSAVEKLETEFAAHKTEFSKVSSDFAAAKETISKQDQAIQGLLTVVEQLAAIPKADPIERPDGFRSATAETREKRLESITGSLKKLRAEVKN